MAYKSTDRNREKLPWKGQVIVNGKKGARVSKPSMLLWNGRRNREL